MSANNLGVSYGSLDLQSRQIEMYQRAAEDNALAKANLAHAYIDRGFLSEGERLTTEILKEDSPDETARA